MQFGANKGQPLLQLVALKGTGCGSQLLFRRLVGNVLHDGGAFAQLAAVVEHQQRHVAKRVDAVIVGAVCELVGFGGRGNRLKRQSCFVQGNVGGQ